MSADNGIYILKTPTPDDGVFEYRVSHCQAIEDIWYENPDGNPDAVVDKFGDCEVFNDIDKAADLAFKMEKEILEDDFCPILEYGINNIELPHSFFWYKIRYKEEREEE